MISEVNNYEKNNAFSAHFLPDFICSCFMGIYGAVVPSAHTAAHTTYDGYLLDDKNPRWAQNDSRN